MIIVATFQARQEVVLELLLFDDVLVESLLSGTLDFKSFLAWPDFTSLSYSSWFGSDHQIFSYMDGNSIIFASLMRRRLPCKYAKIVGV